MLKPITTEDIQKIFTKNLIMTMDVAKNAIDYRLKNKDYVSVKRIVDWVYKNREYTKSFGILNFNQLVFKRSDLCVEYIKILIPYNTRPQLAQIFNVESDYFVKIMVKHCLKELKQNYSVSEMVFDRSVKYGLFDYSKILITHCPMLSEGNLKYRIMELIDYSPQDPVDIISWLFSLENKYGKIHLNSRFIKIFTASFSLIEYAVLRSRLSVVKYFMSLNTKGNPGRCMLNSYESWLCSKMDPDVLSYIINIIPKKKFPIHEFAYAKKKCPRSIYLQVIKLVYDNFIHTIDDFGSLLNPRLSASEYEICHNDVPLELLDIALQRWPIEMVFDACPKYPQVLRYLFNKDITNKLSYQAENIYLLMNDTKNCKLLWEEDPGTLYDLCMLVYYKYGFLDKDKMHKIYMTIYKICHSIEPLATELCPKLIYLKRFYYFNKKEYLKLEFDYDDLEIEYFMSHTHQKYIPKSKYYHLMSQSLKETNWKETMAIMIQRFYSDNSYNKIPEI